MRRPHTKGMSSDPPIRVFSDRRSVPTDLALSKSDYKTEKKRLKKRLRAIQVAMMRSGRRAVIVFEGWDGAGKGGVIKRLMRMLDPRAYHVWPIEAPSEGERRHHYLHRFWMRLPGAGELAIFDRSWYGRVLVERVEGLAPEDAWRRAYREIVDFERLLAEDGTMLVKLWLEVDPETQKRRFARRLERPLKQWKLSLDDFRNLERRPSYEAAVDDMLRKTATPAAPWVVVPCHDKRYGRVAAWQTIAERLGRGLDLEPPPLDPAVRAAAERHLDL